MFSIARTATLVALSALATAGDTQAQRNCKPDLVRTGQSGRGYQLRPENGNRRLDRCEGLIDVFHADPPELDLKSVIVPPDDADVSKDLTLKWAAFAVDSTFWGDSLALLVQSTKVPGNKFRMDAAPPVARGMYAWPVDFMKPERYTRKQVAMLARVERVVDGEKDTIYVPLRVTSAGSKPARQPGYILEVVPDFTVLAYTVTIESVPPNKDRHRELPKVRQRYDAGKPFQFEIPDPGPTGLYEITLNTEGEARSRNTPNLKGMPRSPGASFLFWHTQAAP